MGSKSEAILQEYRDNKEHVPADKPHGNDSTQRWWVNYLNRVVSGTLIDISDTQAVVRSHTGFEIVAPKELYRTYIEACSAATTKLGKVIQEASEQQAKLMVEMAKSMKGNA